MDTIRIVNVACPRCSQEIPVQTFFRMEEPGFLHVRGAREIPRPRWLFEPESTDVVCRPCGLICECTLRYKVGEPDVIIIPTVCRPLPLPLLQDCPDCHRVAWPQRCQTCKGAGLVRLPNVFGTHLFPVLWSSRWDQPCQ